MSNGNTVDGKQISGPSIRHAAYPYIVLYMVKEKESIHSHIQFADIIASFSKRVYMAINKICSIFSQDTAT